MDAYPHGDIARFQHDRFGLFIHWGIYALVGINEWCLLRERIPDADYRFLIDHFDPDLFAPAAWAKAARLAGMKYVVFTTKHHDGFCMWDTACSDHQVTRSPVGRDLLREVVDAFRAEGLRIGLYYSISDWHHPDFLIDESHALGHLPAAEITRLNAGRDMHRYAAYMRDQMRELLTGYGEISELWFDVSGRIDKDLCESAEMVRMVRALQPQIILNDRLQIPESADILTPEGYVRYEGCVDAQGHPVAWENSLCLGAAWGHNRDEKSYFKSAFRFLEVLISNTGLGGNTLYNVGPTSRGEIAGRELGILGFIAQWMHHHARSIHGCGAPPAGFPPPPRDCRYTYDATSNRLYLHLIRWGEGNLLLPGMAGRIRHAQLLSDGTRFVIREHLATTELNPRFPPGAVSLTLMSAPNDIAIPVIELLLI